MQRRTANEERTPQNRRSIDRQKEKTPHIAGTTGGIQTWETDDPEEFSSFLDSFLCRKKMLRKNPPQRRRWNRTRQEDTDKDQYAAARARRKERHDHQINLLRTASSEYSGLQLAQKKRKKKLRKQRIDKRRSTLTGTCQAPLERKSLHDKNDGAEAGDGERRKTTLQDKRRQRKRKTSKESVFRQFLFFFFSEEEGTAPPP